MDMGHGGHGGMGHGDEGMDMQCSMNMLLNWDVKNVCIVSSQWRITGPISLFVSLIAIVLLTAAYEGVREVSRRLEARQAAQLSTNSFSASSEHESSSLLGTGREGRRGNTIRAGLYAFQVFYSLMIMLIFMTYNGWIMLAVAIGAFVGHLTFGKNLSSSKTAACH